MNANEKIFAFNESIKASEDVVPGEKVQGKIFFDTTHGDHTVEEITLKVEALEYHVSPPDHSEHAADIAASEVSAAKANAARSDHHIAFLSHFKKTGRAPALSANIAKHEQHDVKFETTIQVLSTPTPIEQGRHEYDFELTIPSDAPLTTAIEKSEDDVVLILYRYHAVIKVTGATRDAEAFHSLHVLASK
ncbi:hypothetical protein HK100_009951 [Physocladia obscura]|uniref:Uncharacterized protein n=1 Tax=Physocladia obscura TaxID=109957 RepID=A0AAD5XH37_9FUNG|nr:hypothetical protein HK100_009951 [Physocladia obscura]